MPCSIPHTYLIQFFQSVYDFYRQEENLHLEILNEMSGLLEQLINDSSARYAGLENKSLLPVIKHLPSAVKSAGPRTSLLAQAINQLAPFLNWQRTRGYEVLGEDYLEGYGYCSLIGPGLLVEHEQLKLGFGIWRPGLHYPLHYHAAEECYHVIGHAMMLRRQDEQWKTYCDADAIYNPPWVKHELKTRSGPMFLLYTWRGEVGEDAVLV